MAITVQEIVTRINNHFDDSNNDAYSLNVKINWINAAQKDLAYRLPIEFLQKIVKTEKQDTQASYGDMVSWLYPLPVDFLKMVEVLYHNIACKLIKLGQRQMIGRNMDLMPSEIEPIALIREGKIEIFPSLNSQTDGLEIIYNVNPITLTTVTDVIQLDNYVELIFNYVLCQAYAKDNQPEADKYLNLYIGYIAEILGVK